MKTESELFHYYESYLKKHLEPLELYRSQKVRKMKLFILVALVFFILWLFTFYSGIGILIFLVCFTMFIFLGLAYQTLDRMSRHLTIQFKNNLLPEILNFLFDHYEYIPNQRIAKSVLDKSMIFPRKVAIAEGEDFMRFRIGETGIMFCETNALSNREHVVFHGIFIAATFNKHFSAQTYVLSRKKNGIYQKIKRQLEGNVHEVRLEDPDFSKEFMVLSSDQVETRYILTPSLMRRVFDYKQKTNKPISLSFVENRLYCAIPNYKNLFEPALFEPFDFEFIKKNYDPIKLYTDLVDDLNLNVRIWSKT